MKKILCQALCLLALLTPSALADHWYNELLLDYQTLGTIQSHSDDSDMQMTFVVNSPFWLVTEALSKFFALWTQLPLEESKIDQTTALYVTDWKVLESGFFRAVFTGKERRRFRLKWRVLEKGPNQTTVIASAQYQVQDEQGFNDNWKDRSEREFRQLHRSIMAPVATYLRYPNSYGVRQRVLNDYQKGARHGKKGYQLDSAQTPQKPPSPAVAETKACPLCAETILAAAKKCKHCGEYLATPSESPQPSETQEKIKTTPLTPSDTE